jgi:hypothetical protein
VPAWPCRVDQQWSAFSPPRSGIWQPPVASSPGHPRGAPNDGGPHRPGIPPTYGCSLSSCGRPHVHEQYTTKSIEPDVGTTPLSHLPGAHCQVDGSGLFGPSVRGAHPGFVAAAAPSLYRGHRFPVEIISHCVRLYHRFPLSLRDVEEMMAERGVSVVGSQKGSDGGRLTSRRHAAHKRARTASDDAVN